jgi:CheY-like chemotaxis protein
MKGSIDRLPSYTFPIADDEADIRDMLKMLFAAEPDRPVFAEDGAEALVWATAVFPDLVFDVRMPSPGWPGCVPPPAIRPAPAPGADYLDHGAGRPDHAPGRADSTNWRLS